MSETARCLKCQSQISTKAERCPECGFEPAAQGARARWWVTTIGAILTMTVIGAIVGVPMILFAWLGNRSADGKLPTTTEPQ